MDRREVFEKTAASLGLALGRGVRGKGTEVFGESVKVADISRCWIKDEEEWKDRIRKILKRDDLKDLEFVYVFYRDKNLIPHRLEGEAARRLDVKEFLEEELKHPKADTSIVIATKRKLLGYVSLSHYLPTWYDDMVKFTEHLIELKEVLIARDEGGYLENYGILDPDRKKDYIAFHGNGYLWDWKARYVDGRLFYYNENIVDEFWGYEVDELKDTLDNIDPDNDAIVVHRKGKEWYISPNVLEEEVEVYYIKNGRVDYEIETFYVAEKTAWEKVEQIVSILDDVKGTLETKGFIYNETGCFNEYDKDLDTFDLLLEKARKTPCEVAMDVLNYVDWECENIEGRSRWGIEKYLRANLKNRKLFGRYRHLDVVRRRVVRKGGYLTISKIPGSNDKMYAVAYRGEEYHFWLLDLFKSNPIEFADRAVGRLEYRIAKRIEKEKIRELSNRVFVGIEDSLKAGNCKAGTEEFIAKTGINPAKIGGLRGDVVLSYADDSDREFVERTIAQALKRVGLLA